MKRFLLFCLLALVSVYGVTALRIPQSLPELLQIGKPLSLAICKGLKYQKTGKINFFKQSNQTRIVESYIFKAFAALERTGCSKLTKHLACSLMAPPLLHKFGSLPPCRSLCRTVEKSCAEVLEFAARFGLLTKEGCKETKQGKKFRGSVNKTVGGLTCQRWNVHKPHFHRHITAKTHPWEGLEENYCRNPDGEPNGPWCYTTSKSVRWDYCDVPTCFKNLRCNLMPKPGKKVGCLSYKIDPKTNEYKEVIEGTPTISQAKDWHLP